MPDTVKYRTKNILLVSKNVQNIEKLDVVN